MIFLELTGNSQKQIALKFVDISAIVGTNTGCSVVMNNGKEYIVKNTYQDIIDQITSFKKV